MVREFQVTVAPPPPCAPGYCHFDRDWTTVGSWPYEVQLGDVSGDGHLDLISIGYGLVTTRLGRVNGTFEPGTVYAYRPTPDTYSTIQPSPT